MNISLQQIIKVHYGKALKSEERDDTGQYLVYGSNGVVGKHKESFINQPTLIIGRKGSVGAITYAESGGWAIDTTFYIEIIDKNEVDLRYLFYALKIANLSQHTITTSIPGLNRDNIYKTKIPLPPLSEQKRIAAVLDKADEVRAKRRAAIAKLDSLLQSVFLDMFGDPVSNPKGWDIVELNDVCKRITDGTHQPPKFSSSGVPFLFVSNFGNGEMSFNTNKYISEQTYADLTKRCPIEIDDILYTIVGSYGHAAVVQTKEKFAFQRHVAHLKPFLDLIDSEFLLWMLLSPGVRQQVEKKVKGIAQKTLNLSEIKTLKIFNPPKIEQQKFASISRKIKLLKSNQEKTIKNSNVLFQSLQQRAFAGELFGANDLVKPAASES